MKASLTPIDEYIQSCPIIHQNKLNELLQIIRESVPKDASETISYKMPTFRYNGNLIHFALFSKHIGLYPGPDTITQLKDQLKEFKTSKGAIQLPLDAPLPHLLIKDVVAHNVLKFQHKSSPNWQKYKSDWTACYEFMDQLIAKTTLKKEMKWGSAIYTHNGKNVVGWAGFKNFFSLWFYNGVFLSDPYHVLINASEGKTKALRQWRFVDVEQMNEERILEYIQESIQSIKDGKEIIREKNIEVQLTGILLDTIIMDDKLYHAFNQLTLGRQKEYITYIEEAKQEKTKLRRIEKIKDLILAGKGLHDKYKK